MLVSVENLTIPHVSPEVRVFASEVCDPAKSEVVNKTTLLSTYRYKGKEDHYRHALNYFLLAVDKIGISKEKGPWDWSQRPAEHKKVMNEYARI